MAEYIIYAISSVGVFMILYFWYKEATTDYIVSIGNQNLYRMVQIMDIKKN